MNTQANIRPLYQRAPRLSQKELREINGLFPAYLFRRRRTREIWTTCCGVHQTLPEGSPVLEAVHQAEKPPSAGYGCFCGWMSAPPPRPKAQPEACPFCGRVSPVKELGRTGRRENLWSYVRVVTFRQYHGALWAVAYEARKDYTDPARLTALPEAHMVAAYRFLPGRVEFCRRNWWEKTWDYMDAGTIDTNSNCRIHSASATSGVPLMPSWESTRWSSPNSATAVSGSTRRMGQTPCGSWLCAPPIQGRWKC